MKSKFAPHRKFTAGEITVRPPVYVCANVDLRTLRAGIEVESRRAMALYVEVMFPRLKAVA